MRSKRLIIPIISVISFDIISIVAIMVKGFLSDGLVPPLKEVVFSTPICYFWILWSVLIYFAAWGIQKGYYSEYSEAKYADKAISSTQNKKVVLYKYIHVYCKKLLVFFGGLPFAYMMGYKKPDPSINMVVILLFPFVVCLLIYIFLTIRIKKTCR